jgi:Lar family restriction alleviation protein
MPKIEDDDVEPPTALLPCPFCGHRAVLTRLGGKGSTHGWIECVGCRAGQPYTPTFEMACIAWNRRTN